MKTYLAVMALVLCITGCGESIEQREGMGITYQIGTSKWNIMAITVDGHKYIFAVGGPNGVCAICPAVQDK